MRGKRNDIEHSRDLDKLASLYLRGFNMSEIARILSQESGGYSISRVQVSKDLAKLKQMWIDNATSSYEQTIARELAKIDELERSYWEEFEKSKRDSEVSTVEQSFEGYDASSKMKGGGSVYENVRKSTKKSTREGNLKCLDGVQWCLNKRLELLGISTAQTSRVTISWEEQARQEGINDPTALFEELVTNISRKMDAGYGSESLIGSETSQRNEGATILELPG